MITGLPGINSKQTLNAGFLEAFKLKIIWLFFVIIIITIEYD